MWTDDKNGNGEFSTESEIVEGMFTFPTRLEGEFGSSSEEFIGAAHSSYFPMQLTTFFGGEGYAPTSLYTAADAHLDPADGDGFKISRINLTLDADAPSVDEETFDDLAQRTKGNCPMLKALAGPELTLITTLARGRAPPAVLSL